jgi:hypothetical protein
MSRRGVLITLAVIFTLCASMGGWAIWSNINAARLRGCAVLRAHFPHEDISCSKLDVSLRSTWIVSPKLPRNWVGGGPTVELSPAGDTL